MVLPRAAVIASVGRETQLAIAGAACSCRRVKFGTVAKRSTFGPRSANLSLEQMRVAIPILERRLAEIRALDPDSAQDRSDPKFEEASLKLEHALVDIF